MTLKKGSGRLSSRRGFIQLAAAAGAGALGAVRTLRSNELPTDVHGNEQAEPTARSPAPSPNRPLRPHAASALVPGEEAIRKAHQTLSVDGTWSVIAFPLDVEGEAGYKIVMQSTEERLTAQVPGEIHLDLMRIGRLPDPNISDNARTHCRWPEQHSWWYRTVFTLPSDFRKNLRQWLVFDGIDLYGQVFVNGRLAGTTKDAFAKVELDVRDFLKEGENELVVRVTSGMELIPPTAPADDVGTLLTDIMKTDPMLPRVRSFVFVKRRFLRKAAYSAYGWDWCDPLPNIGIWRGARLEGRSQVVIDHIRLDTVIRGKEVSLEGEVILENLHPWSEIPCVLEVRVDPPQGEPTVQHVAMGAQSGRIAVPCRMTILEPRLWWPNGMGEQPLYQLTVRTICGGLETDRRVQKIGLRTIDLDRSPLKEGLRFCFKVNGEDVFCKGGNWAPADLIPARVDATHYRKLVTQAKNADFNMLRVNGGGIYESEDFYDACDRAGILVWQDFMFTDALYPDEDSQFLDLVRKEAEGNVKRLRHHPSLAIWCGNNECEWTMANVWKADANKAKDIAGVKIYHALLPEICHRYDSARPYWPTSPYGGNDATGGISGDCHGWGDPNLSEEAAQRRWREVADEARERFYSEAYGMFGPPSIASVREFLKPEEISLESTAWKIHTNATDRGTTSAGIEYHYGDSKALSLPEFILYGQMYQALLVGGGLDAMRFRKRDPKDDCQGVLFWSFNETWGETGWAMVDHYARRKASYYWFKRSAAPVKVLVRSRSGQLVTRLVNDTLKSYQAVVHCGWVRLDGSARELQRHIVKIPANGMVEIGRAKLPSPAERDPGEWLYAATLTGDGIVTDQAIWLLAPYRALTLAKPVISSKVRNGMLEVSSPVYCHAVHLEDEGEEVLADNYFDLLPGVPRQIPIITPSNGGTYVLNAVVPITA